MDATRAPALALINGPNLNLLGTREPAIYGDLTLEQVIAQVRKKASALGFELVASQSNSEGAIIDAIHAAATQCRGVIINAGGYTHTSIAIRDALLAIDLPVIEVHLSNLWKRESYRHHSYLTGACWGVISGLGPLGYLLAVDALAAKIAEK